MSRNIDFIIWQLVFVLFCRPNKSKHIVSSIKLNLMWWDHVLLCCSRTIFFWQKQQTHMQEVLRQLSQQQNIQSRENQQSHRQQLSSESSEHNVLIQSLKKMVAEKEAKIKQLEEELTFKVKANIIVQKFEM